jgi:hypothetical protein
MNSIATDFDGAADHTRLPTKKDAGGIIDSHTEHAHYLRLILDVLTCGASLGDIRARLDKVARETSNEHLKIHLAPVRRMLSSAALEHGDGAGRIAIALDRPPCRALIAYCRRHLGGQPSGDLAHPGPSEAIEPGA